MPVASSRVFLDCAGKQRGRGLRCWVPSGLVRFDPQSRDAQECQVLGRYRWSGNPPQVTTETALGAGPGLFQEASGKFSEIKRDPGFP